MEFAPASIFEKERLLKLTSTVVWYDANTRVCRFTTMLLGESTLLQILSSKFYLYWSSGLEGRIFHSYFKVILLNSGTNEGGVLHDK